MNLQSIVASTPRFVRGTTPTGPLERVGAAYAEQVAHRAQVISPSHPTDLQGVVFARTDEEFAAAILHAEGASQAEVSQVWPALVNEAASGVVPMLHTNSGTTVIGPHRTHTIQRIIEDAAQVDDAAIAQVVHDLVHEGGHALVKRGAAAPRHGEEIVVDLLAHNPELRTTLVGALGVNDAARAARITQIPVHNLDTPQSAPGELHTLLADGLGIDVHTASGSARAHQLLLGQPLEELPIVLADQSVQAGKLAVSDAPRGVALLTDFFS